MMGMPITVEITDPKAMEDVFDEVFSYFDYIDKKFSPYRTDSELSSFNAGRLSTDDLSEDMCTILEFAEKTKQETDGYFDIRNRAGLLDPSGIVKGWAIRNAASIIKKRGFDDFYVEAGGDVQISGRNERGDKWSVGVKSPLNQSQIVKKLALENVGIATSGTYIRGDHIWDPKAKDRPIADIVSLTVIGPDVYEADRFATAAFAMGKSGINLIEETGGLEGYLIDKAGTATMTTGFMKYVA